MKTLLAIMALLAGFTASAAEEATTKAKKEEIMKEQRQNAPVQEDIDNEITNARMRAESGSKSKHSISASLGYNGGSLNDAFSKTRPAGRRGGALPREMEHGAEGRRGRCQSDS